MSVLSCEQLLRLPSPHSLIQPCGSTCIQTCGRPDIRSSLKLWCRTYWHALFHTPVIPYDRKCTQSCLRTFVRLSLSAYERASAQSHLQSKVLMTKLVSFFNHVAACGVVVAACGVVPIGFRVDILPNFAPERRGLSVGVLPDGF